MGTRRILILKAIFILILLGMTTIFTPWATSSTYHQSKDIVSGNTIYVSKTGSTFSNIRSAVENASSGDIIVIGNGTYNEKFNVSVPNLILKGNSSTYTIIENDLNFTTAINIRAVNIKITNIGFRSIGNNNTLLNLNSANSMIDNCTFEGHLDRSVLINVGMYGYNSTIDHSDFYLTGNLSTAIQDRNGSSGLLVSDSYLNVTGFDSYLIRMEYGSDARIEGSSFETTYPLYSIEKNFRRTVDGTHLMGCVMFMNTENLVVRGCDFKLSGMNYGMGHLTPVGIMTEIDPFSLPSITYHSKNISIIDNICNSTKFGIPTYMSIEGLDGLFLLNNKNTTKQWSNERVNVRNSRNIQARDNFIDRFGFHYIQDAMIDSNTCIALVVRGLPYDMAKNETNVVISNNNLDNLWWGKESRMINPLSVSGSSLAIHNNLIRTRGTGMYVGRSYNIEIFNNDIYFQSFNIMSGGLWDAGILVQGSYSDLEGNTVPSFLSIHHNVIRGHGEPSSDFGKTAPIPAIGILEYGVLGGNISHNRIEMWGNGTYDTDNRIVGIWMIEMEDVMVDHNNITVKADSGIPLLIGEGRMGKVMVDQKVHHCDFIENRIHVEGNRGSGLFLSSITKNCTFVKNDISLKNGSSMNYIRADNLVNTTIEFGEYERVASTGIDLIIFRGHYLVPGYGPDVGPNITTIGLPVKSAEVSSESKLTVLQRLSLSAVDEDNQTKFGVDFSIENDGVFHNTSGYAGTDTVGVDGVFGPFLVKDKFFDGSSSPYKYYTTMKASFKGQKNWEEERGKNIRQDTLEVFQVPYLYPPLVPQNFTAVNIPGSQDIELSWAEVTEHCSNYILENLTGDRWEKVIVLNASTDHFIHKDLPQDTLMKYRLASSNNDLRSDYTPIVTIETGDITPPRKPDGLKVIEKSFDMLGIAWEQTEDNDVVNTEIKVTRNGEAILSKTVGPDINSSDFHDLGSSSFYNISVRFMDDEDQFSETAYLNARTDQRTGSLNVSVSYAEGSPWDGYAPNLLVETILINGSSIQGYTDQLGDCTFDNIPVPCEGYVVIHPPDSLQGELGRNSGYLKIKSGDFVLLHHGDQVSIELVMNYYDIDQKGILGRISGKVNYPNLGPSRGPSAFSNITLNGMDGTLYKSVITDRDGIFLIEGIPLPFTGVISAFPHPDEDKRYRSVNSTLIELTEEDWEYTIGLVLGFEQTNLNEIPSAYILEYGPVGEDVNITGSIFCTFSHPIISNEIGDLVSIDQELDGMEISLDESGRTIMIHHDGLKSGTSYNVTISFLIEFRDAQGLNESFNWEFTTEKEGPNDNDKEDLEKEKDDLSIIWVLVIISMISAGIFSFVYITKRNSVKGGEKGDHEE